MFTGIIEETGILVSSARGPRSCVLNIRARAVLDGTGPGDSIAAYASLQPLSHQPVSRLMSCRKPWHVPDLGP